MVLHPRLSLSTSLLTLATFLSVASAQQGVLASGNTQLPACAQQCTALLQASQACEGTTSASTAVWNCFCQSAYLKGLTSGSLTVCSPTCTAATDNQNIVNWYKSNCGTDYGASEHANGAAPSGTTTTAPSSASTSAAPTPSTSGKVSSGVTNSGSFNAGAAPDNSNKPWIDTHYQWIIFVVVVIVGFAIITGLAVWYKRRYYRRRDQIHGGFNTGVSDQVPSMSTAVYNNPGNLADPNVAGPSRPPRDDTGFA